MVLPKGMDFNQKLHNLVGKGNINELIQKYNADWVITIEKINYSVLGKMVFNIGNVKVFKINN